MMKIENVSMEFVSFDAQDVITTSYGGTKVRFEGNVGLEYNKNYKGFDFGQTAGGEYQTLTKYFAYDWDNKPKEIEEKVVYWKAKSSAVDLTESNDKQSDYTLLESVGQIVAWLKANGYNPRPQQ